VVALVAVASALAETSEPSTVTLELGPEVGHFHGKVQSDRRNICERNRRVVIKRNDPVNNTVGRDHTNRRGRYSLHTSEMSGSWYAIVRRKVTGQVVCQSDRSPARSAG
jgi:hypothetical protein